MLVIRKREASINAFPIGFGDISFVIFVIILSMRKFLFAVVLMLAIVFIITRFTELNEIALTLSQANWNYLILAIFVMVIWLFVIAIAYYTVYRALDMKESLIHLLLTSVGAYFVNVVAPTAGMGGIAIFISEGQRKGLSSARVTIASAIYTLFDYLSFLFLLSLGLVVLFRRSHLTSTELVATGFLIALITILSTLLIIGMRSVDQFGNALAFLARQLNRLLWVFIHREYIPESRAHAFAHDASTGLIRLSSKPQRIILPAALTFIGKLLLLTIFLLIFLAFQVPFSPGTIVAGFSIGYLFWIVSPTPAGIGFVEGALTIGLTTLNVPLGAATVIALSYRAITFWIPLFLGMICFRWLTRGKSTEAVSQA